MKTVNHQFLKESWFIPKWECSTLIIGSFNPECGEETDFFYGRGRNRFWKAVAHIQGLDWSYYQDDQHGLERKLSRLKSCKVGCVDIIRTLKVEEGFIDRICGQGYADGNLFNLGNVERGYNTDDIQNRLSKGDVKQIVCCLGARIGPNEFLTEKEKLRNYCDKHEVRFIDDQMTFSGYGGLTVANIAKYLTPFFQC